MSQDNTQGSKTETPEILRALIEMRGLRRTYALYPDIVATAFERGRRPIGSFPEKFSPITEPASRFTPSTETDE